MKMPLIVFVDDNEDMLFAYQNILNDKYEVKTYSKPDVFLKDLENNIEFRDRIDVILLDLMMPKINGEEITNKISNNFLMNKIPIIIISAIGDSKVKARLLEYGASDFVDKSVSSEELISRIDVQIRLRKTRENVSDNSTNKPKIKDNVLTISDNEIKLTKGEMDLLKFFIENEGKVLSRFDIEERVFELYSEYDTNIFDTMLSRLRKKLAAYNYVNVIKTVRGFGWVYEGVWDV